MNSIQLPKENKSLFYNITSANRTQLGAKISEFVNRRWVEFKLLKTIENKHLFRYRLHHQNMKGTALIHKFSKDVEIFYDKVDFVTDFKGNLIGIKNFNHLVTYWKRVYRFQVREKYRRNTGVDEIIAGVDATLSNEKTFLKNFIGYSFWRLFFQDRYRTFENEEESDLYLKGYFGNVDLPLKIHDSYSEETNEIAQTRKGMLDKKKFNRHAYARMLKNITNVYNLDSTLLVDMEENYVFTTNDNNSHLNKAELYLQTNTHGWYDSTSAHTLKRLTRQDFENELNNNN